mmetsp:Transcript_4322/g.6654  ORF Transcript_4322/g.6654 Transcript_4322/m.6654 type:complete len:111 (+) Transcript_4322:1766-2098(+)
MRKVAPLRMYVCLGASASTQTLFCTPKRRRSEDTFQEQRTQCFEVQVYIMGILSIMTWSNLMYRSGVLLDDTIQWKFVALREEKYREAHHNTRDRDERTKSFTYSSGLPE